MKNDHQNIFTGPDAEQRFDGIGVSGEITVGTVHIIQSGLGQVPEYTVPSDEIPREQGRINKAISKAQQQITRLKVKTNTLNDTTADELRLLLDAHAAMLTSKRMIT